MRKNFLLASALAGLAIAGTASAADQAKSPHSLTGNVTFATNYVVRGLSQTNFRPAMQGTLDYAHESGFYAGFFGSNVSWYADGWEEAAPGQNSNTFGGAVGQSVAISNSLETDLYLGFRNKIADSITYDVGGIYYYYPGKYEIQANTTGFGVKKPHTAEVYAGLGWEFISAKLSYAVSQGVFGVADARGSYYAELNANYALGDSGFNLIGHVGVWKFQGEMLMWKNGGRTNSVYDFTDFKLGVTKDWAGFTFGAFATTSTTKTSIDVTSQTDPLAIWGNRYGKNVGDNAFFVTVTKAF